VEDAAARRAPHGQQLDLLDDVGLARLVRHAQLERAVARPRL
jgi:hypothetical protein